MIDDDDFEQMIKNMQRKIEREEEATFSKIVIQEYRHPNHFGLLDAPDALGEIKGPCGDTMKISLKVENGRIKDACFWTDGCGATIACGSMLTKLVRRKTLEEAADIRDEDLTDMLGGLPEEHLHCSVLAVNALHDAIGKYKTKNL